MCSSDLPLALIVGVLLEREWPGQFSYGTAGGGPRVLTWYALGGAAAALVLGRTVLRRLEPAEHHTRAAVAAALLVCPVAVHGLRDLSPLVPRDPDALSPALVEELHAVPARAVIIASPKISYRLLAAAPVYVVAAPPVHVANTRANRPYERVKDVEAWLAGRDPDVARRYGATWALPCVRRGTPRGTAGRPEARRPCVFPPSGTSVLRGRSWFHGRP